MFSVLFFAVFYFHIYSVLSIIQIVQLSIHYNYIIQIQYFQYLYCFFTKRLTFLKEKIYFFNKTTIFCTNITGYNLAFSKLTHL